MTVTANRSALPKGSLVLVTGVNGYIASHVADQLLEHGYAVRGTVRSADKGDWITQVFVKRHPGGRFEVVVVADMAALDAFDAAMDDVHAVAHVASNLTFDSDPNKVIPEVIASVQHIMQTAAKHKSVTRFVYTSSSTAATLPVPNTKFAINSESWNDASVEAAWLPPPYENRQMDVYAASKTQGEREAWKFVSDNKPRFVLNAVLPDFNLGPVLHSKQPASSAGYPRRVFHSQDQQSLALLQSLPPQYFVDVVDTALLHVAALTEEDVQNERLFGYAQTFNFNDWLSYFRKWAPEKQWPEDDPTQGQDLSTVDTKRAEELLKRFGRNGWTSFEDSLRETVKDAPEY